MSFDNPGDARKDFEDQLDLAADAIDINAESQSKFRQGLKDMKAAIDAVEIIKAKVAELEDRIAKLEAAQK
ncbi:MAG: hypothetical protein ABI690_19685 [Chloroflexota bacterium]